MAWKGAVKKRQRIGHMYFLIAFNPLIGGLRIVRSAVPTREREREREREWYVGDQPRTHPHLFPLFPMGKLGALNEFSLKAQL